MSAQLRLPPGHEVQISIPVTCEEQTSLRSLHLHLHALPSHNPNFSRRVHIMAFCRKDSPVPELKLRLLLTMCVSDAFWGHDPL